MDWSMFGAMVGMTALIVTILLYIMDRLEKDIKSIKTDSDVKMAKFESRMDSHATRIDQLYRMFVDLLKENK